MKILLYMNCHAHVLADGIRYVSQFLNLTCEVDKVITFQVINLSKSDPAIIKEVHDQIRSADLVISNPVSDEHGPFSLKQISPIAKKIIVIPYYRFDGFWLPGKYHSDSDLFRIGISELVVSKILCTYSIEQLLKAEPKLLLEQANYVLFDNRQAIIDNYDLRIKRFVELDKLSDIKMFDYFYHEHLSTPLFFNDDHPRGVFFHQLLKLLSKEIFFDFHDMPGNIVEKLDMLGVYQQPIFEAVSDVLGMSYHDENVQFHNYFIDVGRYIKMYSLFYIDSDIRKKCKTTLEIFSRLGYDESMFQLKINK